MGEPVVNLAEVLTISVGRSRKETNWKRVSVTWEKLVNRMREPIITDESVSEFMGMSRDQQQDIKDVGGFVGGTMVTGARKKDNVETRQIVALDADYGDLGLWDTWELMIGATALMHSTHKHTPEKPRLRILAPLSRPVTADEYEPIARRIAQWLDIEAFDDTTFEGNRLMFWPSRSKDGEYVFREMDGEWLDPDDILATYNDWRDMRQWPVSSRREIAIRKQGEKQGDPLSKPGIIGAFNRAYPITEAIGKFLPEIYTPCGENRWTYAPGSSTAGAVVYDDDTFIYSHHGTDPISERLCNAFDMVRIHLFGELDKGAQEDLPDLPSQKAMKKLCETDEKVIAEFGNSLKQNPSDAFRQETDTLERFNNDTTPQGSAVQFVDTYGHKFRYCKEFDWLIWDGEKWKTDAETEVKMLAMNFADEKFTQAKIMLSTAGDKYSKEAAEAEMKRANKLRTSAGRKDMMDQAATVQYEPDAGSYDANPWDLNTPDGILNLQTGEMRDHDPAARCTKVTSCGLHTSRDGVQMWDDFIKYITCNDKEFAEYLQMLMGMAAVGKVYEEGIVISYGPGGNGKSTFFGAVSSVLGDYAKTLNADTVTPLNGKPDENYIVMLRGVRLAVMGETDENAKLAVSGMKRISSQDSIIARQNYHAPLEFIPSHTLIMHTNHLPRLNSLDGGTKRRLAVAPFPATLPPEEIITDYKSKLVDECGGAILQWIVDGAMKFYTAGCKLRKPAVVMQATQEYISSEDATQQFIDDECIIATDHNVPSSYLYSKYVSWCELNGNKPKSKNAFGRTLTDKGFTQDRTSKQRVWIGITHNSIEPD